MAYQALYRTYRPQQFKDVAGQRHIVTTLQNAIKLNKVAHAYLFAGPRGTGKTSLAKIMSKALNCEHGPTTEPCNICSICQGINKGMISDVIEIDAASNNGVDEIRDLRDKVKFLPAECRYKVYIIDEVHMLSQGAFNALLKTLEEPPAHVIFILATTEPHKIPATILSRCQRFDFQSIDKADILARLEVVASEEKINVTKEALELISVYCEGGMRDALSLLDQSVSYSTDDVVDEADVLAVSGNVSALSLLELIKLIKDKEGAKSLDLLDKIIASGKEIPRIINDLIIFLRNMLFKKVGIVPSMSEFYSSDDFSRLADMMSSRVINHYIDILNDALNNIKLSNQKRVFLELAILKMSDEEEMSYQDLLDRVTKLERQAYFNEATKKLEKPSVSQAPSFDYAPDEPDLSASVAPAEPVRIELDDTYLSVLDIERILNNGNKPLKEQINSAIQSIIKKYPDDSVAKLLKEATIGGAGLNEFILVLEKLTQCNLLMKDSYYSKVVEYLKAEGIEINDFYCINTANWNIILNDFKTQYAQGNLKPTLHLIPIRIKKHIIESSNDKTIDELANLFDKDILTIKEE